MSKEIGGNPSAATVRQRRRRAMRAEAKRPDPELVARTVTRAVAFAVARATGLAESGTTESAQEFWADVWYWCHRELVVQRKFPTKEVRIAVGVATASRTEFQAHFNWRQVSPALG